MYGHWLSLSKRFTISLAYGKFKRRVMCLVSELGLIMGYSVGSILGVKKDTTDREKKRLLFVSIPGVY